MVLDDAKKALRISVSNIEFDSEIQDLIDVASADLVLSGVLKSKAYDYTDSLIKRAVITYVKANFGFENQDAEKLQNAYEMLKTHLALSQEYTIEVAV